jgi:hypothetical protein
VLFCVFIRIACNLFVHNVDAIVSYVQKKLEMGEDFFLNESDAKDIMLLPDKAQIPVIRMKKIRYRGHRSGCHVRIHQRVGNTPQSSVLLANLQSLK